MGFRKYETNLPGVLIIEPDRYGDARGYFMELYNCKAFNDLGLNNVQFVQDNLSHSSKGVLRGLHFQKPPHAQGKLIATLSGKVLDMVVDIRKSSPTYGHHFSYELSHEQPTFLYVPEGMAHGFQVLSDTCLFFYKCTKLYNKASEGSIAWNDSQLNLPWKDVPAVLSEKDRQNTSFSTFESPFD